MSLQIPPALFLVSVLVCSIPARVIAAETSPPPKPAANAETGSKDKPPFIVHSPDGTMTVQKTPAHGKTDGARKGLVIRPQVVVPTARATAKERN